MKPLLMAGVALAAILPMPALAQRAPDNAEIVARLNALEAKVGALEQQNAALRAQLAAGQPAAPAAAGPPPHPTIVGQSAPPPLPAAASGGRGTTQTASTGTPATQWTIVPQFNSPDGNFTFKPRGILDVDVAGFNERRGGYDYNNGTQIRRGRFGFDGTIMKELAWRVEAEYVGGTVALLDAYVAYTGTKDFTLTLGQLKVPAGLEANSSDSFNEFLERGMANTAFGNVGGERRVGITLAYANPLVTATGGVYGSNESISRNSASPDEVWGVNGRVTLEPVNTPTRLVHVGVSAYHVNDLYHKDLTIADRPNVRVDNGYLESVAFTGTAAPTVAAPGATVHDATFWGAEAAGVLGPVSVQSEYSHMHLNRTGTLADPDFDGFYVFGSLFLTGESRTFRGGVIDRLKPLHPFDIRAHQWGAFELAGRFDEINLTDRSLSPLTRKGHAWTGALNWYLTGNVKVLFNYIRFTGTNSPLVVAPVAVNGTKAEGDAVAARVHLDF